MKISNATLNRRSLNALPGLTVRFSLGDDRDNLKEEVNSQDLSNGTQLAS